ncbi:MAG: acyl--CoA ligase [Lachnospiraceae bacterium]|nr:acyl--CoA ligase [Lachnospiraceae bacterium]
MNHVPVIEDTVSDLMAGNAMRYAEKGAFVFDDLEYSWKAADEITDRIALQLLEQGSVKGSHIGFWSLNTIELVFYLIACMKIGAVTAVINYSYRTYELENTVRRADIQKLYIGENKKGSDYRSMAEKVRKVYPELLEIRDLHQDYRTVNERYPLETRLSDHDVRLLREHKDGICSNDVLCITFTSGTSAVPKAVMLTQKNVISDVKLFAERMQAESHDVLLAPLPLFHSSGMSGMLLFALCTGMKAIVLRMFKAEEVLRSIGHYHVTVMMAVPSMFELLTGNEHFAEYDTSSLRVAQTSGASVEQKSFLAAVKKLKIKHLIMGYGQTECAPLITATLYEDDLNKAVKTAGLPLPSVEVRIWNLEKDQSAASGEKGEIQVRGPITMKGYYKAEEENQKKFTRDGWLRTADEGFLDGQGRLHFTARLSDMIIRHGENISPVEIENVVRSGMKGIRAVKAVGVRKEIVEEEIACLVQSDSGTVGPDEVRGCVREMLASYKVPKYVFQIKEFPMTATGKIDLKKTKDMAEELVHAAEEKEKE